MKKIILSCCLLAGSAALFTSCAPSKAKVKENFVKTCVTSFPDNVPKETSETYCSCSADKLLEKYSVAEVLKMEEKIKSGDESVKNEMMKVIQPCIDDLSKSVNAKQTGN